MEHTANTQQKWAKLFLTEFLGFMFIIHQKRRYNTPLSMHSMVWSGRTHHRPSCPSDRSDGSLSGENLFEQVYILPNYQIPLGNWPITNKWGTEQDQWRTTLSVLLTNLCEPYLRYVVLCYCSQITTVRGYETSKDTSVSPTIKQWVGVTGGWLARLVHLTVE